MRTFRSYPSRWTQSMLRKVERFRRVALWPRTPGMRFHLRHSPLNLLRERLWLLARLQPQVAIHLNAPNPVRIAAAAPGRMSTLVMNRSFVVSRYLAAGETRMPSASGARAAPSFTVPAMRRAERSSIRTGNLRLPAGKETGLRQSVVRSSSSPAPLAARLARRSERDEELPSLPSRLVRRPAPVAVQPSQTIDGAPRFGSSRSFDPMHATPAWSARADAAVPINVERLTDQVLKNLDRRLIASRERMGRV